MLLLLSSDWACLPEGLDALRQMLRIEYGATLQVVWIDAQLEAPTLFCLGGWPVFEEDVRVQLFPVLEASVHPLDWVWTSP